MTFFPDFTREMNRKLFTISYALMQNDISWNGIDLKTNRSLNLAITICILQWEPKLPDIKGIIQNLNQCSGTLKL